MSASATDPQSTAYSVWRSGKTIHHLERKCVIWLIGITEGIFGHGGEEICPLRGREMKGGQNGVRTPYKVIYLLGALLPLLD